MSKIKVGNVVEIFQMPFTKQKSEGKATIKKINATYDSYVDAIVEFKDEVGALYFRAVAFD